MSSHIKVNHYEPVVQKFLFACAYWVILADNKLDIKEQKWMIREFGEAHFNGWLLEFAVLSHEHFVQSFDILAGSLPQDIQSKILPFLHEWLVECCYADGSASDVEKNVIKDLIGRLKLVVPAS
jgi:hypothetical protein